MNSRSTPDAGERLLARRLQRLRLQRGWNMDRVAAEAGISRTTLFHLERGEIQRPRASTLHKLAQVFGVEVESLQPGGPPEHEAADEITAADRGAPGVEGGRRANFRQAFDRATNPAVTRVATDQPELFAGWSVEDWDELYSQFATGGGLREEGVRITAARINHDREVLYRLRVVLQTHLADVASGMVDTLYKLVSVEPEGEALDELAPPGP